MSIVEDLIRPLSMNQFLKGHFQRSPFAAPFAAHNYRELIDWTLLKQIIESDHDDCWLVKNGFKHPVSASGAGRLEFNISQQEFSKCY